MTIVVVAQQLAIGDHYGTLMMMFVMIIEGNEPREHSV